MPKLSRTEQARLNGAQSRGPITPEGKAISSRNSLKHGFAALINVVLRIEDQDAFTAHLNALRACYNPQDYAENLYVDQLAAITWRQARLIGLETALLDAQTGIQLDDLQTLHPASVADPYFHLVQTWLAVSKPNPQSAENPTEAYDISSMELLRRYQTSLDRQHRNTLLNLTLYRRNFANAKPAAAPEPAPQPETKSHQPTEKPASAAQPNEPKIAAPPPPIRSLTLVKNTPAPASQR